MLINKNKLINNQFEEHIQLMVKVLESNIQGINSIILYGGYGRGEGVWIESNGSYNPYNDYDILVVLADGVNKPKNISVIKKNLLNKINIEWIDLSCIHLKSFLRDKRKTIFRYDLIHGSKVIFGDSDLLKKIQNIDSSEILINEGKLLFFTRLWPFIGGIKILKDLDASEALFFRYQMSKVVLASVDMILLMRGSYVSSYIERCKIAVEICKKENLLGKEMIDWAIKQKLRPSNEIMSKGEVIVMQEKIAIIFSNYSLRLLSKVYKKNFSNLIEFKKFYCNSFFEKFKIFAGFALRKKINYNKIHPLNIVQLIILYHILGEISLDYTINECNKLLQKLGFSSITDLDSLKELVASERLN